MTGTLSPPDPQPCVHCGECAQACPETLDPEALFLALAGDDWAGAQAGRLDACSECNRCVEVCPSHIPLLDWFHWGKSELGARQRAELARGRFLARNARLQRERDARAAKHNAKAGGAPGRTISKSEVLAAIARGRARRAKRAP